MKKILTLSLVLALLISFLANAQDKGRTRTIGDERYRSIIENYVPSTNPADNGVPLDFLILSENFDNTGGQLPSGWTKGGSGSACQWNVDASPSTPGYYSAGYSLNYNNGTDFNCSDNWGWVRTGLIPVNGGDLNISFWFNMYNECTYFVGSPCGWDETRIIIWDETLTTILYNQLIWGAPSWNHLTFSFINTTQVNNVYIEFYFDTYDAAYNDYYGPFIDNLEVYGQPLVPISNWALFIGIALIATFVIIRYRR